MLANFGERQQQLLNLLLENKSGMTMDELARALGVSKPAVHQHLTVLERDGYVARHALVKTGGRPSQIFVLSDRGIHLFPKQYAWFSKLLLQQLLERMGSEAVEKLLYQLGRETAASLRPRLEGLSLPERLQAVVRIMGEFGYEATLEGETVAARNCVYHNLAKAHPEVCALDAGLLEGLLDRKVIQRECMVRGGGACRFCPLREGR
ncbi:DeoR family transcriptional regulator, suf operon transcriptional repressor [Methylomarinovum caldicuralii]|uniref:DeoR family transcriptional regulator, suf operon transcriptional repressor n=1 Tax=Methylomarinovum caldicuralii TaxID=438856 RepID=A0AAU9C8X5_9GAMM|nr:winged helix-turn-helix transcriptional regulator [Methylomarinovum caldicuralii]BCX81951.1 DeoR family transcriptional regulator, suf operon transcriptional repressor [Methylomarinovum caldicuralii]